MARDFSDGFAPVEIIFELSGGFLFARHHLRLHDTLAPKQFTQLGAGGGVVAHAFGDDVACTSKGDIHIGYAFFRADILGGFSLRIGSGLLGEDQISQRFKPLLLRDHRARAALRTVWLINIFQPRQRISRSDIGFEFFREQIAFFERLDDGIAALVEFGEADEAFADGRDGDFIERAGGFLAVAGDKGHGRAFGKKSGGGKDLTRLNFEFGGDFLDVNFVHFKSGRMI